MIPLALLPSIIETKYITLHYLPVTLWPCIFTTYPDMSRGFKAQRSAKYDHECGQSPSWQNTSVGKNKAMLCDITLLQHSAAYGLVCLVDEEMMAEKPGGTHTTTKATTVRSQTNFKDRKPYIIGSITNLLVTR